MHPRNHATQEQADAGVVVQPAEPIENEAVASEAAALETQSLVVSSGRFIWVLSCPLCSLACGTAEWSACCEDELDQLMMMI